MTMSDKFKHVQSQPTCTIHCLDNTERWTLIVSDCFRTHRVGSRGRQEIQSIPSGLVPWRRNNLPGECQDDSNFDTVHNLFMESGLLIQLVRNLLFNSIIIMR